MLRKIWDSVFTIASERSRFAKALSKSEVARPSRRTSEGNLPVAESEDRKQNDSRGEEQQRDRISIFIRGAFLALLSGMIVSLVLALVPGFGPADHPFQTRLTELIQTYGIPTSSAILVWMGLRSALRSSTTSKEKD
jgi:threonine/homoserine/homoserine lactone efflux protein